MRRLFAALVAVVFAFPALASVKSPGTPSSAAIGTAAGGVGIPVTLSQSSIPFIHISTGSIGNNGALTGVTALPRTYSGGAYVYYPANSIAAGVAAGWYWTIFSSTTAGTIYNCTYTSGTPAICAQTAFSTTGPGAFTGDTTERAGPTITVPANSLGANGSLRIYSFDQINNTAGNKTLFHRYSGAAGTAYQNTVLTTQLTARRYTDIFNVAATNSQTGQAWLESGSSTVSQVGLQTSTVDTTAATTVVIALLKATATDNIILENYRIEVLFSN